MFLLLVLIQQQEIIEAQRKHQAELEAKLKDIEGKFQGCIVD